MAHAAMAISISLPRARLVSCIARLPLKLQPIRRAPFQLKGIKPPDPRFLATIEVRGATRKERACKEIFFHQPLRVAGVVAQLALDPCINQHGGIQVNHSTRVRRLPALRSALTFAISSSTSDSLRVGLRAIIRSSTLSMRCRSSSLSRSARCA